MAAKRSKPSRKRTAVLTVQFPDDIGEPFRALSGKYGMPPAQLARAVMRRAIEDMGSGRTCLLNNKYQPA
jgi:hypothetical protein